MKKKVISFSWGELEAGGSNFGDTVIFKSQVESFKKMDVEVAVLSANPDLTKKRYPGVIPFDISGGRLKAIITAVRWSDIVVVGGGELVQDVSSLFYSPFNLLPLFLAALFRKKAFAWAVGIGQGKELFLTTQFLTKMALKVCDGITVRDRGSFNVLYKLGFREPRMQLVSDCAFSLPIKNTEQKQLNILGAAPRNVSNRTRKLLPLEIRKKFKNYKEPDALPAADVWADVLDKHIELFDSEVILFPFHTGSLSNDDFQFCDLVRSRMNYSSRVKLADPSEPDEFINLISRCRVLVTTPLHGLIMAVASETVPVSISYSSKCTRFMEQAGLENFIVSGDAGIPGKQAVNTIKEAWINSEKIHKALGPVRDKLVQRAEETVVFFKRIYKL